MAQAARPSKKKLHPRPKSVSSSTGQDLGSLQRRRQRAGRMFDRGSTPAEVARALGVSRQSTWRWHQAWVEGGSEGLASTGKRGRTPRLSSTQLKEVEEALEKGARSHGYATDLWTLDRVREVIESVAG